MVKRSFKQFLYSGMVCLVVLTAIVPGFGSYDISSDPNASVLVVCEDDLSAMSTIRVINPKDTDPKT